MSKNHSTLVSADTASETAVVKKDVIKTILFNLAFLGLLLGLFFWNRGNGSLDSWFDNLIKI